jgi:L-threonylcarbamoyladenylate synthase
LIKRSDSNESDLFCLGNTLSLQHKKTRMTEQEQVQKCVEIIKQEGIILYPTDTIYGLGCDATNEKAIQRIYELKKRPSNKSFIVLLHSESQLNRYVKEVPPVAYDLLDCVDKPTTIIYPNAINLPKLLLAEDGSLGIRIVKEGFAHQLMRKINVPLVSTSANFSGEPSAAWLEDIHPEIVKSVDFVVNLPQHRATLKASSIIKLQVSGEISIIRK